MPFIPSRDGIKGVGPNMRVPRVRIYQHPSLPCVRWQRSQRQSHPLQRAVCMQQVWHDLKAFISTYVLKASSQGIHINREQYSQARRPGANALAGTAPQPSITPTSAYRLDANQINVSSLFSLLSPLLSLVSLIFPFLFSRVLFLSSPLSSSLFSPVLFCPDISHTDAEDRCKRIHVSCMSIHVC